MLAQKIKRARMLSGKTQEQVCEALGFSQSKYSRLETGECEPGLSELRALAACFGVPLQGLIGSTPLVVEVRSEGEQAPPQEAPEWAGRTIAALVEQQRELSREYNELLRRYLAVLERAVPTEAPGAEGAADQRRFFFPNDRR